MILPQAPPQPPSPPRRAGSTWYTEHIWKIVGLAWLMTMAQQCRENWICISIPSTRSFIKEKVELGMAWQRNTVMVMGMEALHSDITELSAIHFEVSILHTSGYPNTESPKMDIPFVIPQISRHHGILTLLPYS